MHLNLTDPRLIAGAVVIVLIIVIGVAFYVRNRRKTTAGFRNRFGPEYDRAVLEHGSEHKAEAKLADRESRGGKSENPCSYCRGAWALFCRLAVGAIPLCRSSEGRRDGGR